MRWQFALTVLVLSSGVAGAQTSNPAPPSPNPPKELKEYVSLVGAGAKDTLAMSVLAGKLPPLGLRVIEAPPGQPKGQLWVLGGFSSNEQPPHVVEAKIQAADGKEPPAAKIDVDLGAPRDIPFQLELPGLRAGKTYTGMLVLTASRLDTRWTIALTTGARGVMAVDPIGPRRLEIYCPPCAALGFERTGEFSITLEDQSETGPYTHVRASFEAPAAAAADGTTSSLGPEQISFWEDSTSRWSWLPARLVEFFRPRTRFDLWRRGNGEGIDLQVAGQRTIRARVAALSAGQYTGTLAFKADESPGSGPESKLPLTLQVRHVWIWPILVIFIGSAVGWYSAKYIVASRKAREAGRLIDQLSARADYLARPQPWRDGWEFSSEAHSYGLALVRVMLRQLRELTASTFTFIVVEDELRQGRENVERRLSALETLRETRNGLQKNAYRRPAVQLAAGRLLRQATDLVGRPTFNATEIADFNKLMDAAKPWLTGDLAVEQYRDAYWQRRRDRGEVPDPWDLSGAAPAQAQAPAQPESSPTAVAATIQTYIRELLDTLPSEQAVKEAMLDDLTKYDQQLAQLALMWREQRASWASDLMKAYQSHAPLDDLFGVVDTKVWAELKEVAAKGRLTIERANVEHNPKTFDLVEAHLETTPELGRKILKHPLRIGWRITGPQSSVRTTETNHDALVQYFPAPGHIKISAVLNWQEDEIEVPQALEFDVTSNPGHRTRRMFSSGTEWAAIAIAVGFTMVTAMRSQYTATFGSYSQYLDLFMWAAGAATGGNLFNQLGTTSTPGGRSDATLPAAPTPAIR